jgi:hypothetical protein
LESGTSLSRSWWALIRVFAGSGTGSAGARVELNCVRAFFIAGASKNTTTSLSTPHRRHRKWFPSTRQCRCSGHRNLREFDFQLSDEIRRENSKERRAQPPFLRKAPKHLDLISRCYQGAKHPDTRFTRVFFWQPPHLSRDPAFLQDHLQLFSMN